MHVTQTRGFGQLQLVCAGVCFMTFCQCAIAGQKLSAVISFCWFALNLGYGLSNTNRKTS